MLTLSRNYKMDWSDFSIGGVITLVIKELFTYIREKNKKKTDLVQNARDMAEITNSLFPTLLEKTVCNRVMIFRATNSAGIIAPGKILKISVVYEDVRGLDRIFDDIQEWRADTTYYQIFSDMMTQGSVKIETEKLPEEAKLRNIYEAQGIKYSEIYHLTTTPKNDKVFYCSVASSKEDHFNVIDKYHVDIMISRLRGIFDKHKDVL